MTAGLQVWNSGGFVQIDDTYRNLVFIQKFSFTTAGDHSFSVTGRTSPVAVFSTADANGVSVRQVTNPSAGSFTWRVNGITDVYIFDVPPPASLHGQGLQVFDAAGNLAFDSNFTPLKMVDYVRVRPTPNLVTYPTQTAAALAGFPNNDPAQQTTANTVEVTGASAYVVPALAKVGFTIAGGVRGWYDSGSTVYKFTPGFLISASRVKVRLQQIGTVGSGQYWPGASSAPAVSVNVVDLTGTP